MSDSGLKWRGDEITVKLRRAAAEAIDETMQEAVQEAQANHPGWESESGTAEASIQVTKPARPEGHGTSGEWESQGVWYFPILEFDHGGALRAAADRVYLGLAAKIRRKLRT